MKQKNIFLITLLLLCNLGFAQNKMTLPDKTGVWILDKTVANVDFYHIIKECSGNKVVFLKFNNRNSYTVKVSWHESFSTQFGEELLGAKGQKHLTLNPGVSSYSDCLGQDHREFISTKDDVSPAYVAIISRFAFKDIQVSVK